MRIQLLLLIVVVVLLLSSLTAVSAAMAHSMAAASWGSAGQYRREVAMMPPVRADELVNIQPEFRAQMGRRCIFMKDA